MVTSVTALSRRSSSSWLRGQVVDAVDQDRPLAPGRRHRRPSRAEGPAGDVVRVGATGRARAPPRSRRRGRPGRPGRRSPRGWRPRLRRRRARARRPEARRAGARARRRSPLDADERRSGPRVRRSVSTAAATTRSRWAAVSTGAGGSPPAVATIPKRPLKVVTVAAQRAAVGAELALEAKRRRRGWGRRAPARRPGPPGNGSGRRPTRPELGGPWMRFRHRHHGVGRSSDAAPARSARFAVYRRV